MLLFQNNHLPTIFKQQFIKKFLKITNLQSLLTQNTLHLKYRISTFNVGFKSLQFSVTTRDYRSDPHSNVWMCQQGFCAKRLLLLVRLIYLQLTLSTIATFQILFSNITKMDSNINKELVDEINQLKMEE
jgi:hypothetical protein